MGKGKNRRKPAKPRRQRARKPRTGPGAEEPTASSGEQASGSQGATGRETDGDEQTAGAQTAVRNRNTLTLGDEQTEDGPVVLPRPGLPERAEPVEGSPPPPPPQRFIDLQQFIEHMEPRHVVFAFALVEHGGNRSAAARKAKVSDARAATAGHQWALREDVRKLAGAILMNSTMRLGITVDAVIHRLWWEANHSDDGRARVTAQQALLKHFGAEGPTKTEITGKDGGPLATGVSAVDIEKIRAGVLGQTKGTA